MTVKEIAELCGVDDRTVLRWSKNVNIPQNVGSLQNLDEEIRQGKATDFPVETAAAIIRAGGKEALASLLEENAANKDAVAVYNDGSGHTAEQIRQAAMEGIKEITEIAGKMLRDGYPGDPLRDMPIRLRRVVFENGGRAYVVPQSRKKLRSRILVYDESGAFVRVWLCSAATLSGAIVEIAKQCGMGGWGACEDVDSDDVFKWHIELACKKQWKAVLEFKKPEKEKKQLEAPVSGVPAAGARRPGRKGSSAQP